MLTFREQTQVWINEQVEDIMRQVGVLLDTWVSMYTGLPIVTPEMAEEMHLIISRYYQVWKGREVYLVDGYEAVEIKYSTGKIVVRMCPEPPEPWRPTPKGILNSNQKKS